MPAPPIIVRDGVEADLTGCLALDADYETSHVWQMHVLPETEGRGVEFRTERLPRAMDVRYPASQTRLMLALERHWLMLVAAHSSQHHPVGYLTGQVDPEQQVLNVLDIVVERTQRRQGIGGRLFRTAARWARERQLAQLIARTQTRNYPAIQFLQAQGLRFCGFNDQAFLSGDIAVYFCGALR